MSDTVKKTFTITGMQCDNCAKNIEKYLNEQPGVATAHVNFDSASLLLDFAPEIVQLEDWKVHLQGYGMDLLTEDQ